MRAFSFIRQHNNMIQIESGIYLYQAVFHDFIRDCEAKGLPTFEMFPENVMQVTVSPGIGRGNTMILVSNHDIRFVDNLDAIAPIQKADLDQYVEAIEALIEAREYRESHEQPRPMPGCRI